jgi:uncharacterized membrane protein
VRNRRNRIELAIAAGVFGVLSAIVWAVNAPRELVPAIWIGGMLGLAGTGYWRGRGLPSPGRGGRS